MFKQYFAKLIKISQRSQWKVQIVQKIGFLMNFDYSNY